MNKILLDTNAYSHYLLGDERVLSRIAGADIVYMSIFVLGELYYGYALGNKEKENREKLNTFLEKPGVFLLEATRATSEFFASIKKQLKEKGTPIPLNDVWIAAHNMEMGAELITFDKHFKNIEGLRTWKEQL